MIRRLTHLRWRAILAMTVLAVVVCAAPREAREHRHVATVTAAEAH